MGGEGESGCFRYRSIFYRCYGLGKVVLPAMIGPFQCVSHVLKVFKQAPLSIQELLKVMELCNYMCLAPVFLQMRHRNLP